VRRRWTVGREWVTALSVVIVVLAIVGSDVRLRSTPFAEPIVPRTTAVFGSGIAADALANTQIGGTSCDCPNLRSSFRFRARRTVPLVAVRVYLITDAEGYAAGTGGTIRASIRADDGTPEHRPTDATLATATVPLEPFPRVLFGEPAPLVGGSLYHLVFENTDAAPTENFVSINSLFVSPPISPRQAQYDDVDWAQLLDYGDGWQVRPEYTPILQLESADGIVDGVGYMESWIGAAKTINGVARARETFAVSGGDVLVSRVAVRLGRVSGSGPLLVRLESGTGELVTEGSVDGASVPMTVAGADARPSWVVWSLADPVTLSDFHRYHLVLSTDAATRYQVHVIRKGIAVGFRAPTFFGGGYAQFDPGTGWVAFDPGWRGPLDQGDLQFYFD
jgi:hypothetical protein